MRQFALGYLRKSIRIGLSISLIPFSISAFAQQDTEQTAKENLEVIQVTALRRATTVEDTGMSVSAVGGQELSERAAVNFQDFMRTLPGVNFSEGAAPGEQDIIIRGINFPSNRFQLPTVSVYVDEINLSQNGRNPDIDLIDMNRIEVLRGPQGTLYGGSSMGGAVRYITNKADLDMQEGWVEAGIEDVYHGDFGYKTAFMFNQPLSDTLAIRFVGYRKDLSGWIDNVGHIHTGNYELIDATDAQDNINDELTYGGRVAVRWQPSDDFSLDFMYLKHDSEVSGLANWNPNLIDQGNAGDGYGKFKAAVRSAETYSDSNDVYSLTFNYEMDFASATWISTFTDREFVRTDDLSRVRQGLDWWVGDFNSQFSYSLDSQVDANGAVRQSVNTRPIDYELTTHEARLVGTALDERLNWIVGGIFSKAENNWRQYEIYGDMNTAYSSFVPFGFSSDYVAAATANPAQFGQIGSDTWFYTNRDENIEQTAVYGNVSYAVTDKWEVSGGLRWYDVDIHNDYTQGGYFGGTQVALASSDFNNGDITEQEFYAIIADNVARNYETSATFNQREDGTQFMLNTSYDFGDTLVFMTVAEGFRIGGVNRSFPIRDGSFPVPQTFDSDSLISTEIGLKSRLFNGNLGIDAAIYNIDWEDIQFSLTDPVTSFTFNTNAGEAKVQGAEVALRWQATGSLELNANATLLDHSVEGLTADAQSRGISIGDPLLGVSDERFGLGVNYQFDWRNFDGYVRVDYQYTGDYLNRYSASNAAAIDVATAQIGSYETVDVSTGLHGEAWDVQFYIRNLFNKDDVIDQDLSRVSFNSGAYANVSGNPGRVVTLRPRTLGVSFRYRFE